MIKNVEGEAVEKGSGEAEKLAKGTPNAPTKVRLKMIVKRD
jgi:hypothetical protein